MSIGAFSVSLAVKDIQQSNVTERYQGRVLGTLRFILWKLYFYSRAHAVTS